MTSVIDLSSQVRSFELGTVNFRSTWGRFGLKSDHFLELIDSQDYLCYQTYGEIKYTGWSKKVGH